MLEVLVEGLRNAAVVDTATTSTIFSRPVLHNIKESLGKPVLKLELPCMPLYERKEPRVSPRHHTPMQVMIIFSCDGRKVTVPTFIQLKSEQHCP